MTPRSSLARHLPSSTAPEELDAMRLPVWRSDLNEPTIQTVADLAKKYGFIEEAPALDDFILRD